MVFVGCLIEKDVELHTVQDFAEISFVNITFVDEAQIILQPDTGRMVTLRFCNIEISFEFLETAGNVTMAGGNIYFANVYEDSWSPSVLLIPSNLQLTPSDPFLPTIQVYTSRAKECETTETHGGMYYVYRSYLRYIPFTNNTTTIVKESDSYSIQKFDINYDTSIIDSSTAEWCSNSQKDPLYILNNSTIDNTVYQCHSYCDSSVKFGKGQLSRSLGTRKASLPIRRGH